MLCLWAVITANAQTLRPEQFASSVIAYSSQFGSTDYSAGRALGKPDVYPSCGSNANAWTSATANGQREYLVLGFSNPQPVNIIRVYQAVAPGAIDTVYLRDAATGVWHQVYSTSAAAPGNGAMCPGTEYLLLEIVISTTDYNADAIRLAINSPAVTSYWNEIDAVSIANFDIVPGSASVYATEVIAFSSEYTSDEFSAAKALGAPDVPLLTCSTHLNAWASETQNGQREFLELKYGYSGFANRVMIYQITAPGAIDTVYLREAGTGTWHKIYEVSAAETPCPVGQYLEINFDKTTYRVDAVRIAINSPAVTSYWNEIDAIGLQMSDLVALPVLFGTISAFINNGELLVSWQTLSETNNHHFEIEVSADGETFSKIGTVLSKAPGGNASTPLQYTFEITMPATALMGLSIMSLLGLALAERYRSRRFLYFTAIVAIGFVVIASCNKNEVAVEAGKTSKVFIRIVQVDIDGSRSYSKTLQVVKE